jgi:hypothetical protein
MEVSYRVISVNQDANCMEVEFSADGHEAVLVGVRIPLEDEDVNQVIQSFVPTGIWFPRTTTLASVEAGFAGVVAVTSPSQAVLTAEQAAMWAQVNFEKQLAKALVKFGLLESDPTIVEVTQL